jgi:hypothetical protein
LVGVWTLLTCGDGVTELGTTPRTAVKMFEDVRAGAVGDLIAVSNQLSFVLEIVGIGELWVFGGLVGSRLEASFRLLVPD